MQPITLGISPRHAGGGIDDFSYRRCGWRSVDCMSPRCATEAVGKMGMKGEREVGGSPDDGLLMDRFFLPAYPPDLLTDSGIPAIDCSPSATPSRLRRHDLYLPDFSPMHSQAPSQLMSGEDSALLGFTSPISPRRRGVWDCVSPASRLASIPSLPAPITTDSPSDRLTASPIVHRNPSFFNAHKVASTDAGGLVTLPEPCSKANSEAWGRTQAIQEESRVEVPAESPASKKTETSAEGVVEEGSSSHLVSGEKKASLLSGAESFHGNRAVSDKPSFPEQSSFCKDGQRGAEGQDEKEAQQKTEERAVVERAEDAFGEPSGVVEGPNAPEGREMPDDGPQEVKQHGTIDSHPEKNEDDDALTDVAQNEEAGNEEQPLDEEMRYVDGEGGSETGFVNVSAMREDSCAGPGGAKPIDSFSEHDQDEGEIADCDETSLLGSEEPFQREEGEAGACTPSNDSLEDAPQSPSELTEVPGAGFFDKQTAEALLQCAREITCDEDLQIDLLTIEDSDWDQLKNLKGFKLGDKGRAILKSRISRELRANADLRAKCQYISGVRCATTKQLFQLAQRCKLYDALPLACRYGIQFAQFRPPLNWEMGMSSEYHGGGAGSDGACDGGVERYGAVKLEDAAETGGYGAGEVEAEGEWQEMRYPEDALPPAQAAEAAKPPQQKKRRPKKKKQEPNDERQEESEPPHHQAWKPAEYDSCDRVSWEEAYETPDVPEEGQMPHGEEDQSAYPLSTSMGGHVPTSKIDQEEYAYDDFVYDDGEIVRRCPGEGDEVPVSLDSADSILVHEGSTEGMANVRRQTPSSRKRARSASSPGEGRRRKGQQTSRTKSDANTSVCSTMEMQWEQSSHFVSTSTMATESPTYEQQYSEEQYYAPSETEYFHHVG